MNNKEIKYSNEKIQAILQLLNGIHVNGVENMKLIMQINNILIEPFMPKQEKEDTTNTEEE